MSNDADFDLFNELNGLMGAEDVRAGIDLSDEAILAYMSRQPSVVKKTLDQIERAEVWPADHDWEAVYALVNMGKQLTPDDLSVLGDKPPSELIKVLGYIRMSRALLIVNSILDEGGEAAEAAFLSKCKAVSTSDAEAGLAFKLVLNRLLYLKRSRLIQRIWSPKRAQRINEALKVVTLQ